MMAAFERPVRGLEALARDIPARICLATQVGAREQRPVVPWSGRPQLLRMSNRYPRL